jgi:hypothetical protein
MGSIHNANVFRCKKVLPALIFIEMWSIACAEGRTLLILQYFKSAISKFTVLVLITKMFIFYLMEICCPLA